MTMLLFRPRYAQPRQPASLTHTRAQGDFVSNLQVLVDGISASRSIGETIVSSDSGGADEHTRRPRVRRT